MEAIQEVLNRVWENLIARPVGPFGFRFLLQPTMAAIFAIRDGVKDARTERSPYFWTVLSNPGERRARLHEGVAATSRIIILGLVVDAIYQFQTLGRFYPGEAIIIAVLLAFVPYLLIRGPTARIARWWSYRSSSKVAR